MPHLSWLQEQLPNAQIIPNIVGNTRAEAANSGVTPAQSPVETLPIAASTLTPLMKEQ